MASIKFLLQGKHNPANINVLLSLGRGKQFKRNTGLTIDKQNWKVDNPTRDRKVLGRAGMPKQTTVELKNLHTSLIGYKKSLLELLNKAIQTGTIVDGNWLQEQIDLINNKVPVTDLDILENILEHRIERIKLGKELRSVNTRKGLQTLKSIVARYQDKMLGGKKILIREVDQQLGDKIQDFMTGLGYSIGYVGFVISSLKTICYYADAKLGIKVNDRLEHMEAPKQRKKERVKEKPVICLSDSEQALIADLDLHNLSLINARKWLLFGCLVGQRASDLLQLKESDIIEHEDMKLIEMIQQKTDKTVSIPLLPSALEIIADGFPYKISIQKFNLLIKELCKLAGIDEPTKGAKKVMDKRKKNKVGERYSKALIKGTYPKYELVSTHICRRSFCSNFYGKIPTPLLIEISGHGSESMFLRYIGKRPLDKAKLMMEHFNRLKDRETKTPTFEVIKNTKSI